MNLPDRHMLIGMTFGAVCASALAITGPGMVVESFADELINGSIANGFDPKSLVIFKDRLYEVEHEDWVSTKPLSTQVVKKVEAGRVSYVTIATTATGTYSTDGMFSNHVQYPGISVDQVPSSWGASFYYLSGGTWRNFVTSRGNSFYTFRSGSNRVTSWGNMTCVSGKGYSVC